MSFRHKWYSSHKRPEVFIEKAPALCCNSAEIERRLGRHFWQMRSKINDTELEMSLECGGKLISNMVGVLLPRTGDR